MNEDVYAEKLAWFKQNERPEVVLLVADNPEFTKIIVAWINMEVRPAKKLTELTTGSENEIWEWLWENARYSRTVFMERIGVAVLCQ